MNKIQMMGQNVILRQPIESDIDDRIKCGRIPEIVRMFGGDTRNITPFSKEEAIEWYNNAVKHPYVWQIEYEKKCIGGVRLTVNEQNKRARYACGIHDSTKLGMGLGTEATKLILDYAFNVLNLHKVDLRVLDYNKRAIASYKKCGFIVEGVDRDGAYIEEKWESDLFMSILEPEYRKQYN